MRKCPRCWWETPRQYSSKESHFVWGKRYPLRLSHADTAAAVTLSPRTLHLQVRPGTDTAGHDAVLQAWYRQQKTPECLEYILVHELLHLLEPSHNRAFVDLMNRYLAHWQELRHDDWLY